MKWCKNTIAKTFQAKLDFVRFLHNPMTRKSAGRSLLSSLSAHGTEIRNFAVRWKNCLSREKGRWWSMGIEMKRGYGPPVSQDVNVY